MSTCLWCACEPESGHEVCGGCRNESAGYNDARSRRNPGSVDWRYLDGYDRGMEMNTIVVMRSAVLRPEDAAGQLAGARQVLRLVQWWVEKALLPAATERPDGGRL